MMQTLLVSRKVCSKHILLSRVKLNKQFQYEAAYKPEILGNWEVPNWFPKRPCKHNNPSTVIVSNDRGHLIPGVPRSKYNPWGAYIGTWTYPRKITRKWANDFSGPRKDRVARWRHHCIENAKLQQPQGLTTQQSGKKLPKEIEEVKEKPADKTAEKVPEQPIKASEDINYPLVPYIPGDISGEHVELSKNRFNDGFLPDNHPQLKGFPRSQEDFSREETKDEDLKEVVAKQYEEHKRMTSQIFNGGKRSKKKQNRFLTPVIETIKNFDLAKKLHKENLEHHPLPDTISDCMYHKMQMERACEPGLALKDGLYASGVAWKGYGGYGPTRCTKLTVFRPKTSISHKIKDSENDRPSSVSSFDRKWRFIRKHKVSPIQLAVCWDLTPENPRDEPQQTPHIDGSNGSQAPAVFALVAPTDKEKPTEPTEKCDGLLRSKSAHPRMVKDKPRSNVSSSKDTSTTEYCSEECSRYGRIRSCVACDLKNIRIKDVQPKSGYKMAFRAGVPQKNFGRQDYPEHWRLATVYQHSYKPIQSRKKSLLATVYK